MMFRYLMPFLGVFALNPYAGIAYATLDAVFANSGFFTNSDLFLIRYDPY